jgi:hypothetical protein
MSEQHEVVFAHMQVASVLATCAVLLWTHSFATTGTVFAGLEACGYLARAWHRWRVERVRRQSVPPGAPA